MNESVDSLIAGISGKVKKTIQRGDISIVLFTVYLQGEGDCYTDWNIVAIDKTPKIIWRVNPAPEVSIEGDLVFTNIYIGDDGKLMAYAWKGYDYVIDESNGQVSRWHDPSWPPGYKPRPW